MNDNEVTQKVLADINTIYDIGSIRMIAEAVGKRRKILAQVETATWKTGQNVRLLPQYHGRKPYGAIGTIEKINAMKMKVRFDDTVWVIPKQMLELA